MRLPQTPLQGFLFGAAISVVIGTPIAYVLWEAEQPPQGSRHCRLMVSPDFTQRQQQEIRHAAHKWEKAVGNKALIISVQVGSCPIEDVVEACLVPTDYVFQCGDVEYAVGCTERVKGWDYPRVDIDVACGDLHTLSHITQHEIGHVLGLPDTDTKGVVMHRYSDCGEMQWSGSQDVSQSDVEKYWRIHVLPDNLTETR